MTLNLLEASFGESHPKRLKSRGFNFEEVNLKDQESLKRLLAVITLAFCWAYHVGAWLHEVKPIRVKKHQRPAKSVFRYGFDWIRHLLFNPQEKQPELKQVLTLLRDAIIGLKASNLKVARFV